MRGGLVRSHEVPAARLTLAAAVGALAVSNALVNRVLDDGWYVPWNVALGGLLYAVTRRAGLDAAEIGLGPGDLRGGMRLGAAGAVVIAGVHAGLAISPVGRSLYDDARVGDRGPAHLCWTLAVRIPVGTVALEEFAFRGVLPALVRRAGGPPWTEAAVPAALFGLWHLLPSADLHRANAAVSGPRSGRSLVTVRMGSMVLTGVASLGLHRLRAMAGHLVAPVIVHAVANDVGFATAWRRRRPLREGVRSRDAWRRRSAGRKRRGPSARRGGAAVRGRQGRPGGP